MTIEEIHFDGYFNYTTIFLKLSVSRTFWFLLTEPASIKHKFL